MHRQERDEEWEKRNLKAGEWQETETNQAWRESEKGNVCLCVGEPGGGGVWGCC